jgi:hypothetical protein
VTSIYSALGRLVQWRLCDIRSHSVLVIIIYLSAQYHHFMQMQVGPNGDMKHSLSQSILAVVPVGTWEHSAPEYVPLVSLRQSRSGFNLRELRYVPRHRELLSSGKRGT